MTINQLPAKTWNFLHMNGAELTFPEDVYEKEVSLLVPEGESRTEIQYLTKDLTEGNRESILRNRFSVAKGGSLTLIQIQTLPEDALIYNAIEGKVEQDGAFRLIQLILGGGKTYYETKTDLSEEGSSFEADIAYHLEKEEMLDMNFVADHKGRRSESRINVSGVLKENAKKLFRGTIDFHKGCAGAKGAELEDVLLLNEGVVNQTIPLILCNEEDVEGSHGATIGKPDEELIFYMKSRGIPEDEIYRMMARSKIDVVAGRIKDAGAKEYLAKILDEEQIR